MQIYFFSLSKNIRRKFATALFAKRSSPGLGEATPNNTTPQNDPSTERAISQERSPIENANSIEDILYMDPNSLKVQSDQSQKKIDILPRETVNEIVRQFAQKSDTTPGVATAGIAALCQAGGTHAGNPSLKRNINGITFDLQTLRGVVEYVTSRKGTVRQLAKSMRDAIAAISMANDWPGPLANAFVKEFPEEQFNSSDLVYAAEYHDDNRNPEFPPVIAKCLAIREARARETRRIQTKTGGSPSKKSKKKKGK